MIRPMDSLDYLRLLDDDATRDATMSLVAAVVASDGVVHEDELRLLTQLDPRRSYDAGWVRVRAAEGFDADALSTTLSTDENRWRALLLAARVAWTDRHLATEEKALLVRLAVSFGLPEDAVEKVLGEMVGNARRAVTEADVRAATDGMPWEELEFTPGPARSALAQVATDESSLGVLRIEGVEIVVLFPSGFAAGFREGDAFVRWSDIAQYSRIPVFGAALRIDTTDDRTLTLVDVRARPIGAFLDRVFAR
jgi:hypothetical protein